MKFTAVTLFTLTLLSPFSFVLGQKTPGPSPTQSIGCEPHGDHWHCDGPRTPTDVPTTSTTATTTADPGPSPVESVGCKPHGDHWHCDGPASAIPTTGAAAANSVKLSRCVAMVGGVVAVMVWW